MEEIETYRTDVAGFSPRDVVLFPSGLPGFKEHHRFLLDYPDGMAPLIYLRSVESPHPRFILLPVEFVDADYEFKMEPWDHDILFPPALVSPEAIRQIDDLSLYFVVSVVENSLPTVNMLAPIAIRSGALLGVQAVRGDSRYSHAEPLAVPPHDDSMRVQ
jgi:flagellar assembly factor FliW